MGKATIYKNPMNMVHVRVPAGLKNKLAQRARRKHEGNVSAYIRQLLECQADGLCYCDDCGHPHTPHYQPERRRA